jgi:galactose mutarotase-like enzyme
MSEIIESSKLKVEVSESGAEMKSIFDKERNKELIWQADPAFWPRRAPVLFPIVGKLKDNKFRFEGKEYELSQHGFARDKKFNLDLKGKNYLAYSLQSDAETLKNYPFKFKLSITYILDGNSIRVRYEVVNTDSKTLYFSIGGHPGFACPVNSNEKFSDYYLEFEKEETVSRFVLQEGLVGGKKEALLKGEKIIPLSPELFAKDALIFKDLKSSYISLKNKKGDYSVRVDFSGFPYLGSWSKPGASFVCIEPWYGIADKKTFEGDFNEKEGINQLGKGEKFNCEFSITIE